MPEKHEPFALVGFASEEDLYVRFNRLVHGTFSLCCDLETRKEQYALQADESGVFEVTYRSDAEQIAAREHYYGGTSEPADTPEYAI